MIVLKITMMTHMVNSLAEIILAERPKLSEIKATRPFVFIKTPKMIESNHVSLATQRAERMQPDIFPMMLRPIMRNVSPQSCVRFSG
jgi:hypothetical protein